MERALERDSESAEATLVLSLIHHHSALLGFSTNYTETIALVRDLGIRATRLNQRNGYAHWAHCIGCWGLNKHEESIAALERAVELNPNCSLAYGSLGTVLALVGRVEEAIENQQIAIRSNPRDPSIFFRFTGMAMAHHLARRYDSAIDWASRGIHRMPQWYIGHFLLIASLMRAGREAEAQAAVGRCLKVLPQARVANLNRIPLKDAVKLEQFRECLRRAGLPN